MYYNPSYCHLGMGLWYKCYTLGILRNLVRQIMSILELMCCGLLKSKVHFFNVSTVHGTFNS